MTKHKGRKYAGELIEAMLWVREANDMLNDIDGLAGGYLIGLEYTPYEESDEFRITFVDSTLFETGNEPFNPNAVMDELWHELDNLVRDLTLQRRALRPHAKHSAKEKLH